MDGNNERNNGGDCGDGTALTPDAAKDEEMISLEEFNLLKKFRFFADDITLKNLDEITSIKTPEDGDIKLLRINRRVTREEIRVFPSLLGIVLKKSTSFKRLVVGEGSDLMGLFDVSELLGRDGCYNCPLEELEFHDRRFTCRSFTSVASFLSSMKDRHLKTLRFHNCTFPSWYNSSPPWYKSFVNAFGLLELQEFEISSSYIYAGFVQHFDMIKWLISCEGSKQWRKFCLGGNITQWNEEWEADLLQLVLAYLRRDDVKIEEFHFQIYSHVGEEGYRRLVRVTSPSFRSQLVESIWNRSPLKRLVTHPFHQDDHTDLHYATLQEKICNASSLESLIDSNHQIEFISGFESGGHDSAPYLHQAFHINSSEMTTPEKIRCKILTVLFQDNSRFEIFHGIEPKLMPWLLKLAGGTFNRCVLRSTPQDSTQRESPKPEIVPNSCPLNSIYHILRNWKLPSLFTYTSRLHQKNSGLEQENLFLKEKVAMLEEKLAYAEANIAAHESVTENGARGIEDWEVL